MIIWEVFWKVFALNGGYKVVVKGLTNTLIIALAGLVIGVFIGSVIAAVKTVPNKNTFLKIWQKINDIYVVVFRGTPIVAQLLVGYYVLLPSLNIRLSSLVVAIIFFGLNSGAYVSEIMRGGINSIDVGQAEAAKSLGLTYAQSMSRIILPQAIKNIIPMLGNEFIALIKETSVAGFITVIDLTLAFRTLASGTYEYVAPYLILSAVYLILVLLFTYLVKLIERRLRRNDKHA